MRIFLSHSSRLKPLIREIRGHLPHFLAVWIDEDALVFGDNVPASIRDAISSKTDYVLLFLDRSAVESEWVRQEVAWALEAEKQQARTILLPITVEQQPIEGLGNIELANRKHLDLRDLYAATVHAFSALLSEQLFALVCRDVERLHRPVSPSLSRAIAESDELLRTHARLVHKVVFPHRRGNPISRDVLREIVNTHSKANLSPAEFDQLILGVVQRNLLPGLNYDGEVAFLVEEHAQWKGEVQAERKQRVGLKAINLIENGMKVLFDAGSASEAVIRLLCKRIQTRTITRISLATNSVNIADMVSDCCVAMGFDDDYSAVSLFVPGGRVRPNTQAIVAVQQSGPTDIAILASLLGGFDIVFVGVNGIHAESGLTTHSNAETRNKLEILAASSRRYILGDCSKIGISLEHRFASFEDDINLIVDRDDACPGLASLLERHSARIILAP
ncbi:MAG: hypothetical protein HMLKMBBP_01673 [Planctomycetes bacterium]|nr:hypothetical protein [Planctomycetota bacterium]